MQYHYSLLHSHCPSDQYIASCPVVLHVAGTGDWFSITMSFWERLKKLISSFGLRVEDAGVFCRTQVRELG